MNWRIVLQAILGCMGFALIGVAHAAELNSVQVAVVNSRHTQLQLNMTNHTPYRVFTLKDPARVVVDLADGQTLAKLQRVRGGLVRTLRAGRPFKDATLRLVFEVAKPVEVLSRAKRLQGGRWQLKVDLMVGASQQAATKAKSKVSQSAHPRPVASAKRPTPARPKPVQRKPVEAQKTTAPAKRLPTVARRAVRDAPRRATAAPKRRRNRELIVAIDAGHGGHDPGAKGGGGTLEKEVNLAVAKRLAALIGKERGMRALMIRDGDQYVALRQRMERARARDADLFLSIHADAFRERSARGSSVYVLSNGAASSEAARWLAQQANASDLVGGVSLNDKDKVLASVLLDLSQAGALDASYKVGGRVLEQLGTIGRLHKRKVQRAPFMVLRSPDIPSILVETAFISNPAEERKLRSTKHQARLAKAILTGIKGYFDEYAPVGTWWAQHRKTLAKRHVVARGESLSLLAQRYRVTMNKIRKANRLRSDSLRIGQVLLIPRT